MRQKLTGNMRPRTNVVDEVQRPYMTAEPVGQRLCEGSFRKGVVGAAEHRHEDLGATHFATVQINDVQCRLAIVDEQLLARAVFEPQHWGTLPEPMPVMDVKCGVLQPVRMRGSQSC